MAITSKNHNAIPVVYFASGAFLDTGTVKKSILNLGFKPRYVKFYDVTALKTVEVFEGQADAHALNEVTDGTKSELTTTGPSIVENLDSGAVDTWTVYETATIPVGTTSVGIPAVDPVEKTDNSRLNRAGEKFTGVSIPAALFASSDQVYWVAFA